MSGFVFQDLILLFGSCVFASETDVHIRFVLFSFIGFVLAVLMGVCSEIKRRWNAAEAEKLINEGVYDTNGQKGIQVELLWEWL